MESTTVKEKSSKINYSTETITRSKKVSLMYSFNTNAFAVANKQWIPMMAPPIGGSKSAIEKIMANWDEMIKVMPAVIDSSPDSKDVNFRKDVKYYFDSINENVPTSGLDLEIGFEYSFLDQSRMPEIETVMKNNSLTTLEELVAHVEGVDKKGNDLVPYNLRYKYAKPINEKHYIIYRYCQYYPLVANNPEDVVGKSSKIRYYLHDPQAAKRETEVVAKIKFKAIEKLVSIISDEEKMDNIILLISGAITQDNITDKQLFLHQYVESGKSDEFIKIFDDKNLNAKAEILNLVNKGLLVQLENGVIYEAKDSSNTIGDNLDEAVNYFANPKHKEFVNKLKLSAKTKN